ncbi:questin oxidase family protein [Kribbella qitaiheensis]|uniref:Questin oxidase family protein n=1 Tax=Kribbella qitaiheensis TaxID=1544730 RepID=A0A7G6WVN8_9ACTN|nr:questin oxidase family protein [Kribbella qitaiheensis]QNE18053.1 questin oxidase family protein [Kribbella qitaiheensis]
MDDGILDEAYERFARTGPEWGENTLTNHGPMAVEVLVRRGLAAGVHDWVDAYLGKLSELPSVSDRITDVTWQDALGDGRRIGDWSAYFVEQMQEHPWCEVLVTWWPRLLPGIVAGATHGVIRVSHAVRTLLSGDESPAAVTELAHGLAFWAARMRSVPGATEADGTLDMNAALDSIPRITSQQGTVAVRFGQLTKMPAWPASLRALKAPSGPADVQTQLADLVAGAAARYLAHGHGSPVLLVHTATAPNAVLHTLPALPQSLWAPSLSAVWAASAAITAAYAPAQGLPRGELPTGIHADELMSYALKHSDEHVIKFADTALDAFAQSGKSEVLAAAQRVGDLIK